MSSCPTCGRAMLSEWPHDHRSVDPDAALRLMDERDALAATASPGLERADLDTFIAGLDSPNHSEQSRRDWCRLFFRDMQRAASPGLDVERLARARHIAGYCRKPKYKGRGCTCVEVALVIAREYAALAADRETPEGWTLKDVRE